MVEWVGSSKRNDDDDDETEGESLYKDGTVC